MDFTDNLLSIEKKIRRRLKWKLLFQEIQNATYDSQGERIVDVKDLELLTLEINATSKDTKSNKKRISVYIGSKIKKLRWRMNHHCKARQVHSKSFIPEILLMNNEFDTNSVTDHHVKYACSKIDAKDAAIKNVTRAYSAASLKANVNYFNMSCPNIRSKSYLELPEILDSIDKYENVKEPNKVIKDKVVTQKKEKKSLLQIIDNLHLNNSMNSKSLSNSDSIKDVKRQDKSDVLLTPNKSNSCSSKENITPNKVDYNICSTNKKKNCVKNEPLVIRDFQHNLNSGNEDNLNGGQRYIVSGLSSSKCKKSASAKCDVVKGQGTLLLKEQHCTSNSYTCKSYTVNEKANGRKEYQNVDDAFKLPAIPTKKVDNVKKGLDDKNVILSGTYNSSEIAKLGAPNNDQEKIDSPTRSSINRTRTLIEGFLQNLSFKPTNHKFGLNNTKSGMCLSQSDQRYVYKYAQHITGISHYDNLLSIVNYIEQQSPEMTKYILGVTVLDAIGRTNDSKYRYLVASIKKKITAISKDIEKNNFEIYKEYVLWLFEAKRKR